MDNRFDLFRKMGNGLLSYALDAMFGNTSKDKGGNMILLLGALILIGLVAIFLYAGAEAVFLLVRNKFGTKGVKKTRAMLAGLTFMVLGYFSYDAYENYYGVVVSYGSELSYFYAAITLFAVGAIVFFKGLTVGGKSDDDVLDPMYRGNSWLLGGLVKDGWSQSMVQDVAEPLLFLTLGVFLMSYNYMLSLIHI